MKSYSADYNIAVYYGMGFRLRQKITRSTWKRRANPKCCKGKSETNMTMEVGSTRRAFRGLTRRT